MRITTYSSKLDAREQQEFSELLFSAVWPYVDVHVPLAGQRICVLPHRERAREQLWEGRPVTMEAALEPCTCRRCRLNSLLRVVGKAAAKWGEGMQR